MFICDKCKKKLRTKGEINVFGVSKHEVENTVIVDGKTYDLCDDCYKDLKKIRDKAIAEFFGEGDEDGRKR